jgi:hypothetical protein
MCRKPARVRALFTHVSHAGSFKSSAMTKYCRACRLQPHTNTEARNGYKTLHARAAVTPSVH